MSLPDCPYRGQAECEHDACQPCEAGRMHLAVVESEKASVDLTIAREPSQTAAASEESPAAEHPDERGARLDALLFGETQHRVLVSCGPLDALKIIARARLMGVPACRIGTVGGEHVSLKTPHGEFTCSVADLHDLWWNSLARAMG